MTAISIMKGFVLESYNEARERFQNYKMIYLGLFLVNILIRIPSARLGYDSSNIFYYSSVSIILQLCISVLTVNLIITKLSLDHKLVKTGLPKAILRFIKGQILYYLSACLGFLLLVIPALLALFFFSLSPMLEVLEEHKGISSLKRSQHLIRKDIPLVLILSVILFSLYLVLEFVFSRLKASGLGIVIYLISAFMTTFISVIVTLSYLRLIDYLKSLRGGEIITEPGYLKE